MQTFRDTTGRVWTISVDVSAIKRVRALLNVDLLEAVEDKLLCRLSTDPILLCDVVYALCKPDADTAGVSDEDFGRAMSGDALDEATTGLLQELVDFFPLGKRRLLAKALEKFKVFEEKALVAADLKLDSPEMEAELESVLSGIGSSSGEPLEPSASTPAP